MLQVFFPFCEDPISERALRVLYRDTESSVDELLVKDSSASIHQINLQVLMIEINKAKKELNPLFMEVIFIEKTSSHGLAVMRSTQTKMVQASRPSLGNR